MGISGNTDWNMTIKEVEFKIANAI